MNFKSMSIDKLVKLKDQVETALSSKVAETKRMLESNLAKLTGFGAGSRLSRSGTFEAFFDALAALSETAHLVQMFDSTVVRAHVSAAGAKGGRTIRRSAARVAASRRKSISRSISAACR